MSRPPTDLLYLIHMHQLQADAVVIEVTDADELTRVVLDQTIFYPQGGGQPFDHGFITSDSARFHVEAVRFVDGVVSHFGRFEQGSFQAGDPVHCEVDGERRMLHSRIHSAGHVIDMAVHHLGVGWIPGKGYHFPDGPYVEYQGTLDGDKESMRSRIEEECNALVESDAETRVLLVSSEELEKLCRFVPANIPSDKPQRVVLYGEFGVPCGGTHVSRLSEVGVVKVRKIKAGSGGTIRVSYAVEQ